MVNIFIVYEINLLNYRQSDDPTLGNCLFGAARLVRNTGIDKYKYSGYDIGFGMKGIFGFSATGFARNVVIFEVHRNSSPHIDSKKKDILILDKGPTQGLEHTLTAEKMF